MKIHILGICGDRLMARMGLLPPPVRSLSRPRRATCGLRGPESAQPSAHSCAETCRAYAERD